MKRLLAIIAVAGASTLMTNANTANADHRFPSRSRSSFSLSVGSGRGWSVGYSRGYGYRPHHYRTRSVYAAPPAYYGRSYYYAPPRRSYYAPVYVAPRYVPAYDPYCW